VRIGDLTDLPPTMPASKVAELWGCSSWAVYEMVRNGTCPVPPLKLGRKLVWPTAGVLRSVGLNGVGPAEAGPDTNPDVAGREDRGSG